MALQRLEAGGCAVAVPQVLPTQSGQAMTTIESRGSQFRLRVVTYLAGIPLEGHSPGSRLAFDMGRSLALIDRALAGFSHPGESQSLLWDMQRAAELRPLVRHVPGAELQRLVGDCIDVFERQLAPVFPVLRTQVIHNDLNPGNVLLTDAEPPSVAGVIDFGDMLRAPLVVDVAIAASYLRATDDELAVAQRNGTLYRNFQGYSTHAECDLVGLGITSIGMVGPTYGQNLRTLDEYYEQIDAGELALFRGVVLSPDDRLRRDVITRLICHFLLRYDDVERQWKIDFADYFGPELQQLAQMAEDGLLRLDSEGIQVLPAGRLLIRNICMVFDQYLKSKAAQQRFSKVI